MSIDFVDRKDLYMYDKPELKERTRNRLKIIQELGMTECGVAEFGIKGVMSGLYIERVWNFSDKDFDDYISWIKELVKNNK